MALFKKVPSPLVKRIWRITPDTPQGKFVDAGAQPAVAESADARREPHWWASSFELAFGLEVSESFDTVPGAFLDEIDKQAPK